LKLTIIDNIGALILEAIMVILVRNIKGRNIYSSYLLPKRANNKVLNKINEVKEVM